jgi:HKD family nuclease
MSQIDYIAQPTFRTTLTAIERILVNDRTTSIGVAAAYVTSGGAGDLLRKMNAAMGNPWHRVEKRWLTSFDYLRTEPLALSALMSAPASEIRIHDAEFCLAHSGMPRTPFHPKAFLFRSAERDHALAGSGNISRSGLSRGIEAGLVVVVNRNGAVEETSRAAIQGLRTWFSTTWAGATPLTARLLTRYTTLFESVGNLTHPTLTEDDVATSDAGVGAISSADLQKLRVCRHFWIEAGNITKNRGPNLPGNQLMMKRLSRVFFDFTPAALPENTPIGRVEIVFGNRAEQYSLTYSDNKMDKLVLPIPGDGGPAAYDNEGLLFERLSPRRFRLSLGAAGDKTQWLRKSRLISGAFRMTSGRQWGVF